ncbi:hypothetical protein PVAP13_2KG375891 [Panicum virgatum]|uniref:Uncharacterized protein n=1 Tax=Panicum virgatum TaxID=38727 RepID=A0A8T0WBE2_PANVG|nr:hypothetical protein PVAP13_2KG375891 [Panicum virgatum]
MLGEGPWEEGEDADDMWLKMATCVRKVASEVFGVSKGGKQEGKDTWWWNDEVQRAIKEKKECFKRLYLDKSAANIEGYKLAKRVAKRAVSVAKGKAYDDLYQRLGTKEGGRTFIGWLGSASGRQGTSTKSNALRMGQIDC